MKTDSWKRPNRRKIIDPKLCKTIRNCIQTADATSEETQHWYETELKWWGDPQLGFVAIATIVQLISIRIYAYVLF